ncbi:hypothetical protein L596_004816 [Steinernema carpocapsae]|uniref:Prefoldin subunit 1 n=1 Tax=Steinernema carpocapsae TaxID=34508 RepID=A0A4U8UYK6_STECR|nr:hypothetical protein L596_004816 [Steinernema carpocapsae]
MAMENKRDEELYKSIQQLQTMKIENEEKLYALETLRTLERKRADAAQKVLAMLETVQGTDRKVYQNIGRAYVLSGIDTIVNFKKESIEKSRKNGENMRNRQEEIRTEYKKKEDDVREKLRALQTKSQ